MKPSLPDDPKILEAIGKIILRHAHLDYMLRMTIKTLQKEDFQTIKEALDGTERDQNAWLRNKVSDTARERLGEGEALDRLLALLKVCKQLTEDRNRLTHDIWVEIEEQIMVRKPGHDFVEPPTLEELEALSEAIYSLSLKLNTARRGFLAEALGLK